MSEQCELPKYRSHKVVQAVEISTTEINPDGSCRIYFDEPELGSFMTGPGWSRQYKGTLGDKGYYVRYADGYESWSPSKAFEEGYTREGAFSTERRERVLKDLLAYSMRDIVRFENLTEKEQKIIGGEWMFNQLLDWAEIKL